MYLPDLPFINLADLQSLNLLNLDEPDFDELDNDELDLDELDLDELDLNELDLDQLDLMNLLVSHHKKSSGHSSHKKHPAHPSHKKHGHAKTYYGSLIHSLHGAEKMASNAGSAAWKGAKATGKFAYNNAGDLV